MQLSYTKVGHTSPAIIATPEMLQITCCIILVFLSPLIGATINHTLPHHHPYPEAVVQEVQR